MAARDQIEAAHKTCISATMASVIVGFNPWSSPLALYYRFEGIEPPQEENYAMRRGSFMEPGIIKEFTRVTKLKVRRPRRVFDRNFWFVSEEYGFPMGALLDGITIDTSGDAAVEAKTANPWSAPEWLYREDEDDSANDRIPLMYYAQVQHQLAVTGWEHAYVCADVGGTFCWRLIKRDEEVITMITDRERAFWFDNVLAHVPPEADGHRATTEAIMARWPRSQPESVEIINDPEVERLAMRYKAEGDTISRVKKEREGTGNQLKVMLEDREGVIAGAYKVSWKHYTKRQFDLDRFREEQPKLAEQYTKEKTERPLRVTEMKEK